MSQLSDVQENFDSDNNNARINFAKFLIMKYVNTDVEVEAEAEYNDFKLKHPNLATARFVS